MSAAAKVKAEALIAEGQKALAAANLLAALEQAATAPAQLFHGSSFTGETQHVTRDPATGFMPDAKNWAQMASPMRIPSDACFYWSTIDSYAGDDTLYLVCDLRTHLAPNAGVRIFRNVRLVAHGPAPLAVYDREM